MHDDDDDEVVLTGPSFTGTTVQEALAFIDSHIEKGVHCPCCGQFCKLYRRKIHSAMAAGLCWIYQYYLKHPTADWIHLSEFFVRLGRDSSDTAKLRHWGLLEAKGGVRDDGSDRVGYYRITELGQHFVEERVAVPKYIWIHNQQVWGVDGTKTIMIRDALGEKFRYDDLMQGQ